MVVIYGILPKFHYSAPKTMDVALSLLTASPSRLDATPLVLETTINNHDEIPQEQAPITNLQCHTSIIDPLTIP